MCYHLEGLVSVSQSEQSNNFDDTMLEFEFEIYLMDCTGKLCWEHWSCTHCTSCVVCMHCWLLVCVEHPTMTSGVLRCGMAGHQWTATLAFQGIWSALLKVACNPGSIGLNLLDMRMVEEKPSKRYTCEVALRWQILEIWDSNAIQQSWPLFIIYAWILNLQEIKIG